MPTDHKAVRCSQPGVARSSEPSEQTLMLSGSRGPSLALGSPPRQGEGRGPLIINLGVNG